MRGIPSTGAPGGPRLEIPRDVEHITAGGGRRRICSEASIFMPKQAMGAALG